MQDLLKRIGKRTGSPNIEEDILKAVKLAREISRQRGVGYGNKYADPLHITDRLERYPETDADTIIAAILYPVLRNEEGKEFDLASFNRVKEAYQDRPDVLTIIRDTLQIRDINLLARISGFEHTALKRKITLPEKKWLQAFRRMVRKKIADPKSRAFLIRGSQYDIYGTENVEGLPSDARAGYIRMLEDFYIPMAGTLGFPDLQKDLQNQLFRLTQPEAYNQVRAILMQAEDSILATVGKDFVRDENGDPILPLKRVIEDEDGRRRVCCDIIEQRFLSLVPSEFLIAPNVAALDNYEHALRLRFVGKPLTPL